MMNEIPDLSFAAKIQEMLDQALKLADDGVTLSKQGVIQGGGGKLAVPFTIAVACGPGAMHLASILKANTTRDPRSPDGAT
jgi:hypothetical protein